MVITSNHSKIGTLLILSVSPKPFLCCVNQPIISTDVKPDDVLNFMRKDGVNMGCDAMCVEYNFAIQPKGRMAVYFIHLVLAVF